MASHLEVLEFWFGAPRGARRRQWFEKDPAFDAEIGARFLGLYEWLAQGGGTDWRENGEGCLARILVLDQFPRNMFRGTPRAFATDALALRAARHALEQGYDRALAPAARLFACPPFELSEALEDQERACELCRPLAAFAETEDAYRYALAHRDVIARFGRFPHRNAILGRESTPEEAEFLKQPGSSF